MLIGNGEERTEAPAAQQLAGWMEERGWEVRIEPIPSQFVHIDVLALDPGPEARRGLRRVASPAAGPLAARPGFEIIEVPVADAFALGVNAISLGDERALSSAGPTSLNEQLRRSGSRSSTPTSRCSRSAAAAPTASGRRCAGSRVG